MKKILVLLIFILSFSGAHAQQFALHFTSPLGLINKAGIKAEYRTGRMGFVGFATRYFSGLPDFPGLQYGVDWRYYSLPKKKKRSVDFFYAKLLSGHQEFRPRHGDNIVYFPEVLECYYYGAGAGVGRHINFGSFFMEFNTGLKLVAATQTQQLAFYITGPAAIIDLHFNFGFQFGK